MHLLLFLFLTLLPFITSIHQHHSHPSHILQSQISLPEPIFHIETDGNEIKDITKHGHDGIIIPHWASHVTQVYDTIRGKYVISRFPRVQAQIFSRVYIMNSPLPLSYTKAFWVRLISRTAPFNHVLSSSIDDKANAGKGSHYTYFPSPGVFAAGHNALPWSQDPRLVTFVRDPNPIQENVWTHYTVTYDHSTLTMTLYTNGEFITSASTISQKNWNGGKSCQLLNFNTLDAGLIGAVSDARVYDRALTRDEVATLYGVVSIRTAAARGATTRDLASTISFTSTTPLSPTGTITITLNSTMPLLPGNTLTWIMWGVNGKSVSKDVKGWGKIIWDSNTYQLKVVLSSPLPSNQLQTLTLPSIFRLTNPSLSNAISQQDPRWTITANMLQNQGGENIIATPVPLLSTPATQLMVLTPQSIKNDAISISYSWMHMVMLSMCFIGWI